MPLENHSLSQNHSCCRRGGLDDDGRNLVSLTSHCLGGRNGVARSKWRGKRLEGKSEK
jgi:hypothetical protein